MRRVLPLALLGIAGVLPAQSVFDASARLGPQFLQYSIKSPINQTISEFTVPLFVLIPISDALTLDVGTAWAQARVQSPGTPTSELSGLTDTQVRANYTIGTDFIVLTAGLNLPTGQQTASTAQQPAATRIASDFLLFPISGFGTGPGATGGIALAHPWGDWNVGLGASVRYSATYTPFIDPTSGAPLRFQPGNEYRARVGVDRPAGTGHFSLGVTYSKFGNDQAEGSVYNTGDRYIGQAAYTNSLGNADLAVSAWDLFRNSGELADLTPTGRENIMNSAVAVGFHAGDVIIEPNVEGRLWTQVGTSASWLTTVGMRFNFNFTGFALTPFVGYTVGSIGGATGTGPAPGDIGAATGNSSMTGFRGTLAIRFGNY